MLYSHFYTMYCGICVWSQSSKIHGIKCISWKIIWDIWFYPYSSKDKKSNRFSHDSDNLNNIKLIKVTTFFLPKSIEIPKQWVLLISFGMILMHGLIFFMAKVNLKSVLPALRNGGRRKFPEHLKLVWTT